MNPESRRDQGDGRLHIGNRVLHTRCEARSPAQRDHFIVERDGILGGSNEEDVGRKVRDVDGCPVGQRVITGERNDDRLPPERLIDDP